MLKTSVLRNAAFCKPKYGILHDGRRHFAMRFAVFWKYIRAYVCY